MLYNNNYLVLMIRMEIELEEESPTSATVKTGTTSRMCWEIQLLLTEIVARHSLAKIKQNS